MKDLIKVLFFVIAGIFFISYVQDAGLGNAGEFSSNGSNYSFSGEESLPRSQYTRSYDYNGDGIISNEEYREGEISRIARELNEIEKLVTKAIEEQNRSPYYEQIRLRSGNTRTENVRDEYVVLEASRSNTDPIVVSGWVLKSLVSGKAVAISRGVHFLEDSRPWFGERDAFLLPGEKAIVNTGYAVGINSGFMENKCTGYLSRQYDLSPSIRRSCPALEDEPLVEKLFPPSAFKDPDNYDACLNAIERVPRCERAGNTGLDRGEDELDECRDFIREYATYDGCVALHKTEPDFLTGPWRLFLEVRREMWRKEREVIVLLDFNGKVVDVLRYD